MKALKEKRLSLRSYLRRGLVILSLFALAFASCGDSSTSTDPTDPGNPTNPTVPAGPTAVAITIAAQPTNPSFQGMPPDLTGMVLQVLWSDQKLEFVESKDFTTKGFYAVPPYCDVDSDDVKYVNELFVIAHSGSTTASGTFQPPAVHPLKDLSVTVKPFKWYADQGPDYTKIVLQGTYEYDKNDPLNLSASPANTSVTLDIPVNVGYPPISLADAGSKKIASITIGNKATTPFAPVTFSVDSYYVVFGVAFDTSSIPDKFYLFEDEVNYKGLSVADVPPTTTGRADMFAKLSATKPNFIVTYSDQTFRTVGWNEFYANVQNAIYKISGTLGTYNDIFWSDDGGTTYPGDGTTPILNWDDEDNTWGFWMQYVPKNYPETTVQTYTSRFQVRVPVYEFDGTLSVARKPNLNENVMVDWASMPFNYTMTDEIATAINDKWVLTAKYARGNSKLDRQVKIVASMFNGAVSGNPGVVNTQGGSAAGSVSAQLALSPASGTKVVQRDWPLTLLYMGERLEEEDTVQVNLWTTAP